MAVPARAVLLAVLAQVACNAAAQDVVVRPNVRLESTEVGTCGATSVRDDSYQASPQDCRRTYWTNCSITYAPMRCPEQCPYIVPNPAFSCFFKCVQDEDCATGNPNRAFPYDLTKTCQPCDVVGCNHCDSKTTCVTCHADFTLSEDKTKCVFWMDNGSIFDKVQSGLLCVIAFLVLFALLWVLIRQRNPLMEINLFSVIRARRHRHLTKALQWEMNNARRAVQFYSLVMNVHTVNFAGVGIALFYNAVAFTVLIAGLLYAVSRFVYTHSRAEQALASFDREQNAMLDAGFTPAVGTPAMIVSRLFLCSGDQQEDLRNVIQKFAELNFMALGLLYVVFYVLLLTYVKFQKTHNDKFDMEHATMADFVIQVKGLPKELVDEPELREWFEKEIRRRIPATFTRKPKVEDMGRTKGDRLVPRPDSQIDVHGVSICYNYKDKWGDIDAMIQQMNMRIELESGLAAAKSPTVPEEAKLSYPKPEHIHIGVGDPWDAVLNERRKHAEQVTQYFEGKQASERIYSSGEAFIVFRWAADVKVVWEAHDSQQWSANGSFVYTDPGTQQRYPLQFSSMHCEPPSVNWWYLGEPEELKKVVKGCAWIAFLIAIVLLLIIYPYFQYVQLPYSRTGTTASGTKTMIMGMIIGNVNMLISIQIWMTSFNVGFHKRETMDMMILLCNMTLTFVNLLFIVLTIIFQAYYQDTTASPVKDFTSLSSLNSLGIQNNIARDMYNFMMPGVFFVGNIMTLVMAGVWPWIWNTLLMKVIYVWAALPRCLLKVIRVFLPWAPDDVEHYHVWRAEKALEPMEIQIGTYADLVVNTTMCCSLLFQLSPYTNKLFKMMLVWSIFYYYFLRYLHLRFCKKCYYTANYTDNVTNYLWGIPLSVVGAAFVQWGFKAGYYGAYLNEQWKLVFVIFACICSFAGWVLTYKFYVRPWDPSGYVDEKEILEVEEVKEHVFYSWYNCNPVFTLKCAYYWQDQQGADIPARSRHHPKACGEDPELVRFYSIGKEYLFLKPERQHLAFPDMRYPGALPGDLLEFETYLEAGLNSGRTFLSMCRDKVKKEVHTWNTKVRMSMNGSPAYMLTQQLNEELEVGGSTS